MLDTLKDMRTALENAEKQNEEILDIAESFRRVGNEKLAQELHDIHLNIVGLVEDMGIFLEEFVDQGSVAAIRADGNITEGEQQNKAAVQLAIWYSDRKEEDDFRNQLTDGGVITRTGVDINVWESKMDRWLQLDENDDDEDLIEWLAQNSTGHVYAYARQILKHQK